MTVAEYTPLSTPIYWLGTKTRMRNKILPIIDQFKRKLYVEPFGGACGMMFGKPPEKAEIYNDANKLLTNMFQRLREPRSIETLEELFSVTPVSRTMFYELIPLTNAWRIGDEEEFRRQKVEAHLADYPDEIAVAYAFFYCMNSCYRGRINYRASSFAGGQKGEAADNTVRSYSKARDNLLAYAKRLKTVCIENLDYRKCIEKYDHETTLFYLDPPYATEVSKGYKTGWSEEDEDALVELLKSAKGSFVLSCYDTPRYEKLLDYGATREQFDAFTTIAQHGDGKKGKRTETVYWRGKKDEGAKRGELWE